ncbi:hypothetical protein ANO11243_056040 [Dothideomycetidae sp. 11243]|nr:hypothetical protein ANO11243_056040 [fungal sp. No.11243]
MAVLPTFTLLKGATYRLMWTSFIHPAHQLLASSAIQHYVHRAIRAEVTATTQPVVVFYEVVWPKSTPMRAVSVRTGCDSPWRGGNLERWQDFYRCDWSFQAFDFLRQFDSLRKSSWNLYLRTVDIDWPWFAKLFDTGIM